MIKTTDIFIKTYPKDYDWLYLCLKSINKFCYGFRGVVIVTDKGGLGDLEKTVARAKVKLPVHCHEVETPPDDPKHNWGPTGTGYQFQKAVKLEWTKYSDADACFQVDSDCIFTGHASPWNWMAPDGSPVWIRAPWSESRTDEKRTWMPGCKVFTKGNGSEWNYMVRPGFLMTRTATESLVNYIYRNFNQSVRNFFLDTSRPQISEYNVFGLYLEKRHNAYKFVGKDWRIPIQQNWSWGGLDKNLAGIYDILNAELPAIPADRDELGRFSRANRWDGTAVEIGLFQCMNARILLKSFLGTLIGIDPYDKVEGYVDGCTQEDIPSYEEKARALAKENHNFSYIKAKSEDVAHKIPDNIEFVYIDGNHSYDAVKKDLELYGAKVKRGGLIGGHDFYHRRDEAQHCAVPQAVYEYAHKHGYQIQTTPCTSWWIRK